MDVQIPDPAESPSPASHSSEGYRLAASVLFLMTEYIASRRPLLASLVVSQLLAIERQCHHEPELAVVLANIRRRWWQLAQKGAEA